MRREAGFSVLEVLIIVVVVCCVVAIGVPVLHRGADAAVLDSNLQTLGAMVSQEISEGYSAQYKAEGEGDPQVHASCALQEALTASGPRLYVNPFVGQVEGTQVINSHNLALGSGFIAPAVLITDWNNCQYQTFSDMSPGLQKMLAGTLVVAFNASADTIDVYYVDQHGKGSVAIVSVPTGPVRAGRRG
jgi:type II secretory pathway pseudopilin PulG